MRCIISHGNHVKVERFVRLGVSEEAETSLPFFFCSMYNKTIEGFGGKRALGVLRKIKLCQKRSKFRMQFCLGALNNVLYVFLLKLASFLKYYVCKKPVFVVTSAHDRKDGNFT